MSLQTEIANIESILINFKNDHTCEELADMEERLFELNHIHEIWNEINNIPVNPYLEITKEWHGFATGTHRNKIYDWFENYFGINIANDITYTQKGIHNDQNT